MPPESSLPHRQSYQTTQESNWIAIYKLILLLEQTQRVFSIIFIIWNTSSKLHHESKLHFGRKNKKCLFLAHVRYWIFINKYIIKCFPKVNISVVSYEKFLISYSVFPQESLFPLNIFKKFKSKLILTIIWKKLHSLVDKIE